MILDKEVFLIDANSIITPFHSYYPFDLAESFWSQLRQNIEKGKIIILDLVQEEILRGNDKLCDWIRSMRTMRVLDHRDSCIIELYGQILQYIHTCPLYRESALHEWARNDVADPWIIAAAKKHGYGIVTLEIPNSNPDPRNPWKKAKIPDVARQFDVETLNLFSMMRTLEFRM